MACQRRLLDIERSFVGWWWWLVPSSAGVSRWRRREGYGMIESENRHPVHCFAAIELLSAC